MHRLLAPALFLIAASVGRGAEFSIVPVSADGPHVINGNEIVLSSAGQRVRLEIFVSGWDPDRDGVPKLRAWQIEIDSSGYVGAVAGTLSPAFVPCTSGAECQAVFGGTSVCDPDHDALPGQNCEPGFIEFNRSDYVFATIPDLRAVDVSSLDYRYGATTLTDPTDIDPGTPRYVGTLVLDVPADAAGTFEIRLMNPRLIADTGADITPVSVMPARIAIACNADAECDDGNLCTTDRCVGRVCANTPSFDELAECCEPASGQICGVSSAPPGDADGDGAVDLFDYGVLQRCFGSAPLPPACAVFDTACDCHIDLDDLPGFLSARTGPAGP